MRRHDLPEIQRDEIQHYCDTKGWEVTEWFQDLDLSGRSWTARSAKPSTTS
jgi:DNA invertase Pin-like site-specific DNA recombinase